MTLRYVGPGGSDVASGLSWANRKLTLNGVEDTPVVAGDTIYIGPGTYRETFTADVSGSSGNPITYIGDVFGLNTDGVGGEIRITGSDDDITNTRITGVDINTKDYRSFIGLKIDMCSLDCMLSQYSDYFVMEDCSIDSSHGSTAVRIAAFSLTKDQNSSIVRRCYITGRGRGMEIFPSSATLGLLVENCIIHSTRGEPIIISGSVDSTTIKNCLIIGGSTTNNGVYVPSAPTAQYFYNCVLFHCLWRCGSVGQIIEDYTYYVPCRTDGEQRINVTKGANSITRNILLKQPFILPGFFFHTQTFDMMAVSPIGLYGCGQSPPSDDFYGMPRPTSDAKKTRGPIQFNSIERETTIVPSGETESIKMPDAAVYQQFIPITGKRMSFAVEVYREANYAGIKPQLTIKQPGQSDVTVTDSGSSGSWNRISTGFTPASSPGFVVMQIRSDNTAISGSYATYWGAFEVG